ncbi:hypothetical protein GC175_26710 [bacterium]|nr:hypothetical protein [bacterium]
MNLGASASLQSCLHLYKAFGLIWQMPMDFPELCPVSTPQKADVEVRFGALPAVDANAVAAGPLRQVTPGETRFGLPGAVTILIRGGNEIVIERQQIDDEMIRLLIMGTAAALLLHQRGILPLHGSAIATAAGAVLFLGHSGVGKSTLLNEFLRRGYLMLAEDLAAVRLDATGTAWVEPGVQITKLWADSAAVLEQETEGLARVRPQLEKYVVPVGHVLATAAAPVAAIYVLSLHNQDHVALVEQRDARKFNALLDHTWQKLVVKRMNLHRAHFQQVTSVASQTRITRVQRPDQGFHLTEMADRIEADFKALDRGVA